MKSKILLLLIVAFNVSMAFSQNFWEQTGFNFGGHVYSLVTADNGNIIAGHSNGIYLSTDNGDFWNKVQDTPNDVISLAKSPVNGYLFAGITSPEGGIYRSTNNGLNWTLTGLEGIRIADITINLSGNVFVVCDDDDLSNNGIYKSTDDGTSWSLSGLETYDIYSLTVDNNANIYAGTGNDGTIQISTNDGGNWTEIYNWGAALSVREVAVDNLGNLFSVLSNGCLYKSVNSGLTWNEKLCGINYYDSPPIIVNSENNLFLGDYVNGVYRSQDDGENWEQINSGLTDTQVHCLAFNNSEQIFVGTANSKIFRSIQLVANFYGEPTSGPAPLEVQFYDQSTGNPTSWFWEFGNGETSTQKDPVYEYEDEGSYTVILTVFNQTGEEDIETKADYITVADPLNAEFSGDPTSGEAPLTVNFTDESTGNPTSWFWEFGDGGTSTQKDPLHEYEQEGSYTVILTVFNQTGEEDTETKADYITVGEPLNAEFSGDPTSGEAPLTVNFTDESTGNPTSWFWEFGNGETSTQKDPVYEYEDEGSYTVILTVFNQTGEEDTETKADYITVGEPLNAEFSGVPTSGEAPLTVYFSDESTGNPTTWFWEFGNGETSTQKDPVYEYEDEGSYTVILTVFNQTGEEDTETKADYITVGPLIYNLNIEDLVIHAETGFVDNGNNTYSASGFMNINDIVFLEGYLNVDLNDLSISGDCILYIEEIPYLDRVDLYDGYFEFNVDEDKLLGDVINEINNLLKVANLPVYIDNITFLGDGIRIDGKLELPDIMGHLKIEINTLQITQSAGIDLIGLLEIDDVMVYETLQLKHLKLEFNTVDDYFYGEGELITTNFDIAANAEIIEGDLNKIEVSVTLGNPVPIPYTGFSIKQATGGVNGLKEPPLILWLHADFVPTIQGSFDIVILDNLGLTYTWGLSLEGYGNIKIFSSKLAWAYLIITQGKIEFEGNVNLYDYVYGNIESSLFEDNNEINFQGMLKGTFQIPDEQGFPYDLLRCFIELPFVIAQSKNYIKNNLVAGSFHLNIPLYEDWHYKLIWDIENNHFNIEFGEGWVNWNEILFGKRYLSWNMELNKLNKFEGLGLEVTYAHIDGNIIQYQNKSYIIPFNLEMYSKSMIIRAYKEGNIPYCSILTPQGNLITPENFNQFENVDYVENDDINKSYYIFKNPSVGNWAVNIDASDNSDTVLLDVFGLNVPPVMIMDSLIPLRDTTTSIKWIDTDPDNNAVIELYYDNNNCGANGIKISTDLSEDDIEDQYKWNHKQLSSGIYYVYGVIYDSIYPQEISYSPNYRKIIAWGAPIPPTNLNGFATDTSIILSWNNPSMDTTLRFNVYYALDEEGINYNSKSFNIGRRKQFEFKIFEPGHDYSFFVTAIDTLYRESDYSNIVSIPFISLTLNNAPDILPQYFKSFVYADSLFIHQLICNDPDNDPLFYSLICLSGNDTITNEISVNDYGLIFWTPSIEDVGYLYVKVFVKDVHNAYDSVSFNLTVLNNNLTNLGIKVNDPIHTCYGGRCFIWLYDYNLDVNPNIIDSVSYRIYSTTDTIGLILYANETTPDSKQFISYAELSKNGAYYNYIQVDSTDTIYVEYTNYELGMKIGDFSYFVYEPFDVKIETIGDTLFCIGDPIDLILKTDSSFTSYLWSDGFTKTDTLRVTEPGYYWVNVSNDYGCIETSDTIKIIPLPSPEVILSPEDTITVCENDVLDAGNPGCSYYWSTADTTQTITISDTGLYYVTVTNTYGCNDSDSVYVINILFLPIADFNWNQEYPYEIYFYNKSLYGNNYIWDFGDGNSSTMENPIHKYQDDTTFIVILLAINNCGIDTIVDSVIVTDINNIAINSGLYVYPNPAIDYVLIKIVNPKPIGEILYTLKNTMGDNIIIGSEYSFENSIRIYLNLRNLESGIYFLSIKNEQMNRTIKIIKI